MTPSSPNPGFIDKWHPYGNVDPFILPNAADRVLNEYWDISERLKINSFLLYGTCLGFVRNGGYIDGDNDIDIGILEGFSYLAAALIRNGFLPAVTVRDNGHFLKYGILLDIWFSFPTVKYFQSFDNITYKNRVYNVPHPVEEFLAFSYGDWKTPSRTQPFKGK